MRDYSQLCLPNVLVFCQPDADEIEFYRSQTYAAVIQTSASALEGWKPAHLKSMVVIVSKAFRKARSGTGLFSKSTKNAFMVDLTEKQPMRIFCPANDQEVLDWNKQFRTLVKNALRVHSDERYDQLYPHCGIQDLDLLASFNAKFEQEWHNEQAKSKFATRYS